jgi:4-carboxymuconolactone decarboxylase
MRGAGRVFALVLSWMALAAPPAAPDAVAGQRPPTVTARGSLPPDVDPVSRNRLPALTPGVSGAAAIRLHLSGVNVRWASPLGRALTELAILTTAREHDQPYEWSLHEMEALAVGLDPATIDVVRHRRPASGLGERERTVIELGREVLRSHALSPATYARARTVLGTRDLVDLVDLMASYSATAVRLTAFNQHMPPRWKQFLPLPFTMPDDIHADSRSRLPLIRSQSQNPQTSLYARQLAPEGTGPGHIARHGAGVATLEARVGRRLTALAILIAARELDSQVIWTTTEPAALAGGLEPAVVDLVRYDRPLAAADRDSAIIQFGRELFRVHNVQPATYTRARNAYGERDLVDLVALMAQQTSDAVLLAAFDQHLPEGQKPLLPLTGQRARP